MTCRDEHPGHLGQRHGKSVDLEHGKSPAQLNGEQQALWFGHRLCEWEEGEVNLRPDHGGPCTPN